MDYVIRELKQNEINLLDTFLYEAIFIPEGVQAPSKDIIEHPDLQIYVADFGKKDDLCDGVNLLSVSELQKYTLIKVLNFSIIETVKYFV